MLAHVPLWVSKVSCLRLQNLGSDVRVILLCEGRECVLRENGHHGFTRVVEVNRGSHPVLSQWHLLISRVYAHRVSLSTYIYIYEFSSFSMTLAFDVNRYKLLLEGMLKNTDADHPDRPLLQNAIEQISDVASFINDSIKRRENQAKIWGVCHTP